jgi:hypothetical protein
MDLMPTPEDRIDSFGYADGTLYILCCYLRHNFCCTKTLSDI